MPETQDTPNYLELAADIVAAFVSHNSLPAADLPGLLTTVNQALQNLGSGSSLQVDEASKEPAVPIKKSVTPDYIICLDDGKKFKSLKRHLRSVYDLTPDQYRAKWGLPPTCPMASRAQSAEQFAARLERVLWLWDAPDGLPGGGQPRVRSRAGVPGSASQGALARHPSLQS